MMAGRFPSKTVRSVVRSGMLTTAANVTIKLHPIIRVPPKMKYLIYVESMQIPQNDIPTDRQPIQCNLKSSHFLLDISLLVPYPVFEVKHQKRELLNLSKINRACLENIAIPVQQYGEIDIEGVVLRKRTYAPYMVCLLHFQE